MDNILVFRRGKSYCVCLLERRKYYIIMNTGNCSDSTLTKWYFRNQFSSGYIFFHQSFFFLIDKWYYWRRNKFRPARIWNNLSSGRFKENWPTKERCSMPIWFKPPWICPRILWCNGQWWCSNNCKLSADTRYK
jgi:hypothetical protein